MCFMLLFIGGLGLVEVLIILLFTIFPLFLLIWALVDIIRSEFKDSVTKLIWVIVVIFVPFAGPLLYLILRKGQKAKHNNI
ncbi:hypothetical protein AAE02nite_25640 [Adhaeribacter aerolatus]|uniref:Cardiolipin synthase N-terminal domain-containing protein n=2 Tax=Adhaeribacter aerolatus TaxID=670289 RepID=A0A512AYX1_9BACT|nr:hypothetical protein AAE02nite_25640 [Adhaeribacter aerolatus]